MTALVDIGNGKQRHICYRDSKLTFLLRVIQILWILHATWDVQKILVWDVWVFSL